jgi:hypothetical protein
MVIIKMKRVFIIHGWGGNPKEAWFPWLKRELEKREFKAVIPKMPGAEHPKIKTWTNHLKKIVGKPDENTYFVGHSIGCPAIMHYLEKLPKNTKVGGVVFVAGWFHLKLDAIEKEEPGSSKRVMPWIKSKLNFSKIKAHTKKFIAIFSTNDEYVPLSDKNLFKKRLNAKIIVLKNKGHMGSSSGLKRLRAALDSLIQLTKS